MTKIDTPKDSKPTDELSIKDLRLDVQNLYYLKEFAKTSDSHVGVFSTMSGKTIDEALRNKATFIMGGPALNDRIQQDNKYYSRFKKSPCVDLYDKHGNAMVLIGLIGHIDDMQIIIHPVGQSWVHPIVAHDFKEWDLIYVYHRPGVACGDVQLTCR
jgi:isochorismate hydrolase